MAMAPPRVDDDQVHPPCLCLSSRDAIFKHRGALFSPRCLSPCPGKPTAGWNPEAPLVPSSTAKVGSGAECQQPFPRQGSS